ncbi:MAG: alpha/beta hydrolase [Acidimicrobiia bacterium]|nr:alpha/beta hydrolase [Acidimicrobiia bacterium]
MTDYGRPMQGEVMKVASHDGAEIHTVSAGSGEKTVVLAHGYGFSADGWNDVAELLVDAGMRVVAFDQRGHGRSTIGSEGVGSAQMAGDYAAVLEAHDVQDGVLVGHSMGGFLSIAFLLSDLEAKRRVKSLLLMATFAGNVAHKSPQNKMQIPMIKSGILVRLLGLRPVAGAFTKSLVGKGFEHGMVDGFVPGFRKTNHDRLIPILEAMVNEDRYARLGELDLPTTVVIGTLDKTTPPFHTADLHAGIKDSRLVTLEGKGHSLNWEAPDVIVAEAVRLAG